MEKDSSSAKQWITCEQLTRKQRDEFLAAGIKYLDAQLLTNRGLQTPAAMHSFLDARLDAIPDPNSLIDMPLALARIRQARSTNEHITVYGDFDADGVTSAALLFRALRHLGQPEERLSAYIPSRLKGERGLNNEAIDLLKTHGTSLIITTDCGSSDVEEVEYARSLNIDVIITDHHHPPAQLPQAIALLNPWRPDCIYGERYLCGVGIAFKLAQALYRAVDREKEVWELLDLVAVGTVGDVALLLGENHTLVREGMKRLNATHNPGLHALIQRAGLQPGRIRERDISFVLAPRINAAGRMAEASMAFDLLTTEDQSAADDLAAKLENLNLARQQQTEELMRLVRAQAAVQAEQQVILVSGEKAEWPEGIIGLVAGKLSEETHRPVFVLSRDSEISRGSARSPEHFNLIQALQAARPQLFERFGGHAQAAGFTIANAHIEELHEHLLSWHAESQTSSAVAVQILPNPDDQLTRSSVQLAISNNTPGSATTETLEPEANNADAEAASTIEPEAGNAQAAKKVDLVITNPELVNLKTLEKINQLTPFGAGNPEPIFALAGLHIQKRWPTGSDKQHLRLRLRAKHLTFNGILLRGGHRFDELKERMPVQIWFCLEQAWNPFESVAKEEVWLRILDIQPM